jgi:hypothetical protein
MKRSLFVLLFLFCFIIGGYAQQRTISAGLASWWRSGDARGSYLSFQSNGTAYHCPNPNNTRECLHGDHEHLHGTYYIDANNVVHITWSNGFQEKTQLQYDSNGRLSVTFRGVLLTQERR